MKPEPWGEALDALASADGATARRPDPGGRPFTQALARELADERGWPSPAGATRASTSGSSSTPPPRTRCGESRSATTCSTAARSPCWRSSRRSPGCCPASSATPSRSSRSRTRTGCSSTPSTPSRPSWRGLDVPAGAALAATTARSRPGGTSSACGARPTVGPTCCTRRRRCPTAWQIRPARAGRRRRAPVLQRACWVQEAAGQPTSRRPGARRGARRRARAGCRVDGPASCARAGRLVGAGARRSARRRVWDIGRLMVAPDLQGRGLGRALLEASRRRRRPRPRRTRCSPGPAAPTTCGCTRRAGYRLRGEDPGRAGCRQAHEAALSQA